MGYQSADIPFEKDAYTCGTDAFMNGMMTGLETVYALVAPTTHASSAVMQAHLSAACEVPVSQVPAQPALPTTVPGTTIPLPGNCDWLNSNPYWAPGEIKRDPGADGATTCCYKREFYILVVCKQGGFCWTHWPWHYDVVRKYTWQQSFGCTNNNLNDCPATPACTPPVVSPTPLPGVPVSGPDLYYPE